MIVIELDAKLETFKADAPKIDGDDPVVTLTIKASVRENVIGRLAQLLGDKIVVELHPKQYNYFRDVEPPATNGHQRSLDDAVAEHTEEATEPEQVDADNVALAQAAGDDVGDWTEEPSAGRVEGEEPEGEDAAATETAERTEGADPPEPVEVEAAADEPSVEDADGDATGETGQNAEAVTAESDLVGPY